MTVGYVYDLRHREHTHPRAPESAARLEALVERLNTAREMDSLVKVDAEPIPWEWVAAAHTTHHVDSVRRLAREGKKRISVDTYLTSQAEQAALLSASSAVAATQAVMTGQVASAFSLMRPPGHHASSTHAMGYCIFNNTAVAAEYALREFGLKRIMIVDIDAHHGNGTEEIFYARRDVLFVSLHQHPWFPGTGDVFRTGTEAGIGYNYNVALPTWSGDEAYRRAYAEFLVPLTERYRPELVLVSAGFDAHWMDHSSLLGLSVVGYYDLVKGLRELADRHCEGRIVLILEGGYNLDALSACAGAALCGLQGKPAPTDPFGQCPDPPVAPPDLTLSYLTGFMALMADETDFYDQPVEVPYRTK